MQWAADLNINFTLLEDRRPPVRESGDEYRVNSWEGNLFKIGDLLLSECLGEGL